MTGLHGILLILRIVMALGMIEDMIIVDKDKGVVLTGTGLIAPDTNQTLVSTFIKIKNPTAIDNACTGVCEIDDEILWGKMTLAGCTEGNHWSGKDQNVLQVIGTDKESKEEVDISLDCFKSCLKHSQCYYFGIRPKGNKIECILRSGSIIHKTELTGAKEFSIPCMITDKQAFCKEHSSLSSKLLREENERFVNATMQGLKSMLSNVDSRRQKRNIAPILGGLGFVTGGFALYETFQIQNHVKRLERKFEEFREDIMNFETAVVKFHENILKIYKSLETNMERKFEHIDCEFRNIVYQLLLERRLQGWRAFIDVIAKDLTSGQIAGTISPRLFNKTDVQLKN